MTETDKDQKDAVRYFSERFAQYKNLFIPISLVAAGVGFVWLIASLYVTKAEFDQIYGEIIKIRAEYIDEKLPDQISDVKSHNDSIPQLKDCASLRPRDKQICEDENNILLTSWCVDFNNKLLIVNNMCEDLKNFHQTIYNRDGDKHECREYDVLFTKFTEHCYELTSLMHCFDVFDTNFCIRR